MCVTVNHTYGAPTSDPTTYSVTLCLTHTHTHGLVRRSSEVLGPKTTSQTLDVSTTINREGIGLRCTFL